jgi:hypothetical protein
MALELVVNVASLVLPGSVGFASAHEAATTATTAIATATRPRVR